jgi:ectoine hydroxylase-related dioxygenase (phytanoyl-CoA dioxygenase family)
MEQQTKKQKLDAIDYSEYFEKLKEDGYVVIPSLISREEQLACVNGYYDYAENLGTGIKRNDSSTMTTKSLPPYVSGGIDCNIPVAHKQFVWNIRENEKVINVFADMFGTDKLLTSFDRICFMRGAKGRNDIGLHTDQSSKKKGLHCIQGLITLTHSVSLDSTITMEDTQEDDGTLFVLKKSHDYHETFFKKSGVNAKSDWYKFTTEERDELLQKFENVRVQGPPGSLFLWDSRTFHCAVTPRKTSNRRRLVVYTCYAPKQWATESQIKKKQKAFHDMRATSHWPLLSILFQKPQTYGDETKNLSNYKVTPDRVESDKMKQMSGVKSYSDVGLLGWTKQKKPALRFNQ